MQPQIGADNGFARSIQRLADKRAGRVIGCVALLDDTVRSAKNPTNSLRIEKHSALFNEKESCKSRRNCVLAHRTLDAIQFSATH